MPRPPILPEGTRACLLVDSVLFSTFFFILLWMLCCV